MAQTFDYKEGFTAGWGCLWDIIDGIDALEDNITHGHKMDAFTGALVMLLAANSATEFREKGTHKLLGPIHDILYGVAFDDWGKAERAILELKGKIPIRVEE